MFAGSVGWPDVTIALIAGLPGILAAMTALLVRKEVHTKNGHTLGETVEHTHAKAVETNAVVTRALGGRGADHPEVETVRVERERNGDSESHGGTPGVADGG